MKTIRIISGLLTVLVPTLRMGAGAPEPDTETYQAGKVPVVYDPRRFEVGEEVRMSIGGDANKTVIARKVTWPRNTVGRLVLFLPEAGEALLANDDDPVFIWRSKLYRVFFKWGNQGFYLVPSRSIGTNTLTREAAIQMELTGTKALFSEGSKYVDLRRLLWIETTTLRLAHGLPLREVVPIPEKDRLVVNFVSYSGLRGTVVLDEKLEVLSQTLDEASVKEWEQRWKRKQS